MLTYTFRIDAEEHARAQLALMRREPGNRVIAAGIVLAPVVAVAWSMIRGRSFGMALFVNAFWLALPLAFYLVVVVQGRSAIRRRHRESPNLRDEHRFTFDDAGMRVGAGADSVEVAWSGITGLVETAEFAHLRVGSDSAYFIPKRAMDDQGGYDRLRTLVDSRIRRR